MSSSYRAPHSRRVRDMLLGAVLWASALTPSPAAAAPLPRGSLPGFVVHFDFVDSVEEATALVRVAAAHGAGVVTIVPPAHVWESALARRMLDATIEEASRHHLAILFTRIDASFPSDATGARRNFLYARVLNRPGRMPDGSPTGRWFRTTVGCPGYDEWMEEETRYYAAHYGHLPNLLGINLGPFSEPFASERGGFLEYADGTGYYELTQYTPEALRLWRKWLGDEYADVARVNGSYGTSFASLDDVPMPTSDTDARFPGAGGHRAYFDLVRLFDAWVAERYSRCRRIWHEVSGRDDVPFILQLSGFAVEKLAGARPGAAAFDVAGWIADADAVGLSLYTNSGYVDYGHSSVVATVRLLATARDLGKPAFVLEGGCEAPNVVLKEPEVTFFSTAAAALAPRTWIYEFLKDKYDEDYADNPGKLVRADGRVRPEAARQLRKAFATIRAHRAPAEEPRLAILVEPRDARESRDLARAMIAIYRLASVSPVRWVTRVSAASLPKGVPVLRLDGSFRNEKVMRLLEEAPPVLLAEARGMGQERPGGGVREVGLY